MAQNNFDGAGIAFPLTRHCRCHCSLGERGNPAPSQGMAGVQGSRTVKRRRNHVRTISGTPSGCEDLVCGYRGYRPAQPPANFWQPSRLLATVPSRAVPQPRWGWGNSLPLTQGSFATLGWRTQSRWDWHTDVAPTELRNNLGAGSTKIPLLRSWVSVTRLSCNQSRRTPHPNPLPSEGRGNQNMKNFPAASADRELLKQ
jgi:hypothetical protein